jgi:hypothetical protein
MANGSTEFGSGNRFRMMRLRIPSAADKVAAIKK